MSHFATQDVLDSFSLFFFLFPLLPSRSYVDARTRTTGNAVLSMFPLKDSGKKKKGFQSSGESYSAHVRYVMQCLRIALARRSAFRKTEFSIKVLRKIIFSLLLPRRVPPEL